MKLDQPFFGEKFEVSEREQTYEEALLAFQEHTGIWFNNPKKLRDFFEGRYDVPNAEALGENLAEFAVGLTTGTKGSGFENKRWAEAAKRAHFPSVVREDRKQDEFPNFENRPYKKAEELYLGAMFEKFCYLLFEDQGLEAVIDFVGKFVTGKTWYKPQSPELQPRKSIPKHGARNWKNTHDALGQRIPFNARPKRESFGLREAIEGALGRALPEEWTPAEKPPRPTAFHTYTYPPEISTVYPHTRLKSPEERGRESAEAQHAYAEWQRTLTVLDPREWPEVTFGNKEHPLTARAKEHGIELFYCAYNPKPFIICRGILANGMLLNYDIRTSGAKDAWKRITEEAEKLLEASNWDSSRITPAQWPPTGGEWVWKDEEEASE